jgi:hypothetical protein
VLYTISCADTGASCPRTFVSENQVKLLVQIHRHIATAHPEQPKQRVQKLIKKV